jgi:hypothetical protein
MQRGLRGLLIVGAAGLLALAVGCGGGDGGSGSTTRTVAGRTITVPAVTSPTTSSTATPTATGTVPSTITLPGGQTLRTSALEPFRDCLRRHGVQPPPLNAPPPDYGSLTPQQIAQQRALISARVACIPSLPSPLRQRYERLARQLRQRR